MGATLAEAKKVTLFVIGKSFLICSILSPLDIVSPPGNLE